MCLTQSEKNQPKLSVYTQRKIYSKNIKNFGLKSTHQFYSNFEKDTKHFPS